MEETLYSKIFKEIDSYVSPELSIKQAEILSKDVYNLAIKAQIDLLNKMRDILDIPQDQHECFMNEVDTLQNQLDQSQKQ